MKGRFTIIRSTPIAKILVIAKLFITVGKSLAVTSESLTNEYIGRFQIYISSYRQVTGQKLDS